MRFERSWSGVVNRPNIGRRRADEARRVADLMRRDIRTSGTDWKLPSEEGLIRSFEVSRNTIRDALELLRHEGLLERVTGAGTFSIGGATRHVLDLSSDPDQTLFGDERLERDVLVIERRRASPPVAKTLDIEPGFEVLLVEKVASLRGVPLYHATDWFSGFVADRVETADLRRESCDVLASLGLQLAGVEFSLSVVSASEADARVLAVGAGAPIVLLEMLVRMTDGRVAEWSFVRLRADRLTIIPSMVSFKPDESVASSR
jgi:GntR family transcriptional regulator